MVERVIKALEACTTLDDKGYPLCEKCPYRYLDGTCLTLDDLHKDALTLLKKLRPQTAIIEGSDHLHLGRCPECHKVLSPWGAKYCSECGQAIRWEVD